MKSILPVLFLVAPALLFGQSLAEVARKEKERREKNKKEGKEVHVISESDVGTVEGSPNESNGSASTGAPRPDSTAGGGYRSGAGIDQDGERGEDEDAPTFIPPDAPLPEKLAIYERMKRAYQRQAREIDEEIGKNEARLREIEAELAVAASAGGAGLPVAPRTEAANRQMTGQESAALTGEQSRLQAANEQLRQRKEQLKLALQERGRAAAIPPGYLRF